MSNTSADDPTAISEWFDHNENRILNDLKAYLSIDTSLGQEENAFPFITNYLTKIGFSVWREPLHPHLLESKYVSPHPDSSIDSNRSNLRATLNYPAKKGDRILFNCHIDVVPATHAFPNAFKPEVKDGFLYGRGACDTKGNLFMLTEAVRYMIETGIPFEKRIDLDLPIDEEVGGNGTLSTILHGIKAKEVIVLEPTELRIFRGHRGCLSYSVIAMGKAVHMGSDTTGESAISAVIDIIHEFELLEKELLQSARLHPDFAIWERPLQLNIGLIRGGEWSGSVPERCEVHCDVGFMPGTSMDELSYMICQRAQQAISNRKGIRLDFDFRCGLRNEAYIQPANTSVVQRLAEAASSFGICDKTTYGWRVSCDARHYDNILGLPVVIFGAGSLADAHSANEKIDITEMKKGMGILVKFLSHKNPNMDSL